MGDNRGKGVSDDRFSCVIVVLVDRVVVAVCACSVPKHVRLHARGVRLVLNHKRRGRDISPGAPSCAVLYMAVGAVPWLIISIAHRTHILSIGVVTCPADLVPRVECIVLVV